MMPRGRPMTANNDVRMECSRCAASGQASSSIHGRRRRERQRPTLYNCRHDHAFHLRPAPRRRRPRSPNCSAASCDEEARSADALYILGDLFEAWVGDDDPSEAGAFVADELRALGEAGVPVYFIRGNRDFLLGDDYARRAGMTILPDPAVVLLYGQPTLLMHGDLLCTDDVAYQPFRAQVRDPAWQRAFLSQPLAARLAFAQQARAASKAHQAGCRTRARWRRSPMSPRTTVDATLARFGIDRMIHGHTHRPAIHDCDVDGRAASASCSATGTNRARCCGGSRRRARLRSSIATSC